MGRFQSNHIYVLDLSSHNPDLNAMESLWQEFKMDAQNVCAPSKLTESELYNLQSLAVQRS